MLDDDPNEEAQRQFRRQVDDDVANWISQLDSDTGTGVPPPPQIKVTEVSSQPYEFDLLQPGSQNASTAPALGPHTDPAPTGACCSGTDCTIESEGQCNSHGGTYQGDGTPCDPNPCVVACPESFCITHLVGNLSWSLSGAQSTCPCTADCSQSSSFDVGPDDLGGCPANSGEFVVSNTLGNSEWSCDPCPPCSSDSCSDCMISVPQYFIRCLPDGPDGPGWYISIRFSEACLSSTPCTVGGGFFTDDGTDLSDFGTGIKYADIGDGPSGAISLPLIFVVDPLILGGSGTGSGTLDITITGTL